MKDSCHEEMLVRIAANLEPEPAEQGLLSCCFRSACYEVISAGREVTRAVTSLFHDFDDAIGGSAREAQSN